MFIFLFFLLYFIGPSGSKVSTANENARRRRLSVATQPSEDARQVLK